MGIGLQKDGVGVVREGEVAVNLIGDHEHAVPLAHAAQPPQLLRKDRAACVGDDIFLLFPGPQLRAVEDDPTLFQQGVDGSIQGPRPQVHPPAGHLSHLLDDAVAVDRLAGGQEDVEQGLGERLVFILHGVSASSASARPPQAAVPSA